MGMDWISDTDQQYTTTQGTCQEIVWRSTSRTWKAIVSRQGVAVHTNRFMTLEEAQAWCETQLAALAAAGRCPA